MKILLLVLFLATTTLASNQLYGFVTKEYEYFGIFSLNESNGTFLVPPVLVDDQNQINSLLRPSFTFSSKFNTLYLLAYGDDIGYKVISIDWTTKSISFVIPVPQKCSNLHYDDMKDIIYVVCNNVTNIPKKGNSYLTLYTLDPIRRTLEQVIQIPSSIRSVQLAEKSTFDAKTRTLVVIDAMFAMYPFQLINVDTWSVRSLDLPTDPNFGGTFDLHSLGNGKVIVETTNPNQNDNYGFLTLDLITSKYSDVTFLDSAWTNATVTTTSWDVEKKLFYAVTAPTASYEYTLHTVNFDKGVDISKQALTLPPFGEYEDLWALVSLPSS